MKTLLEVIKLNKGNIDKIKVGTPIDFIDLGLPSKNLWCTCNIGADNPWETGDYFQWGDTKPCDEHSCTYDWETYKFGLNNKFTKYNDKDKLEKLEPEDDVATQTFGSGYRIPSKKDFDELIDNTYRYWVDNYKNKNVSGYAFFKLKGNSKNKEDYDIDSDPHIFMPCNGIYFDNTGAYLNTEIYLWSNTLLNEFKDNAYHVFGNKHMIYSHGANERCTGIGIRTIKSK